MSKVVPLPGGQAEDIYASTWTTRPEVEFINGLCPVHHPNFPRFRGASDVSFLLEEAFHSGFVRVQEFWRDTLHGKLCDLTNYELRIWVSIERKTLRFGKLMEKLPRRVLVNGEIDDAGKMKLDRHGLPILRPSGVHDRKLDATIKALLGKGLIGRAISDPHPLFGRSSIYSPLPLSQALQVVLDGAHAYITEKEDAESADDIIKFVFPEIKERCGSLLNEMNAGDIVLPRRGGLRSVAA